MRRALSPSAVRTHCALHAQGAQTCADKHAPVSAPNTLAADNTSVLRMNHNASTPRFEVLRALCAQTDELLQALDAPGDISELLPQELASSLVERDKLFAQLHQTQTPPNAQERALMERVLSQNQTLAEKLLARREALQQQIQHLRTNRRSLRGYRADAPPQRPGFRARG